MADPLSIPFELVAHGADDGVFVVVAFNPATPKAPPAVTKAFPLEEREGAEAFARALGQSMQVYLESSLQASEPPPRKRGTANGAIHTAMFSLDFDLKSGAHAQENLPMEPSDLDRLLAAAQAPSPTTIFHTGGGLLALWSLQEPFRIATDESRKQAKELSKRFQGRLRQTAKDKFNWSLDCTHDLNRLIRIPGTLNHKYSPAPQVEVWA